MNSPSSTKLPSDANAVRNSDQNATSTISTIQSAIPTDPKLNQVYSSTQENNFKPEILVKSPTDSPKQQTQKKNYVLQVEPDVGDSIGMKIEHISLAKGTKRS